MEQSQKRRDMIKAAKLYYYGNMSQDDIAQLMEISRPKVSRLLTEARQMGIVQISVNDPSASLSLNTEKLRRHFKLEYVSIVPTAATEEATKENIGCAASAFLNENIKENSRIGLSWGTTLSAFVRMFEAKRTAPNAKVVQLVGGTYSQSLNIDGRELVKTLARKLECEHSILQAPLIVHNPALRELMMQEPAVMEHFRLIHTLDLAFVGVGASYYKDSIAYRAHYIAEEEGKQLHELGLVCDICGHQLMADGTEPTTFLSNRVIGVSLAELKQVPLVIGLCAGHKKVTPLLAALRGSYLTGLIIDEVAAIELITAEHIL